MKEKAAALSLALLLAMGLSACDGDKKNIANDNDILGDERPGTQQGTTNQGTNNNGTTNNGTNNNGTANNSTSGNGTTNNNNTTRSTTGGMNKGTNNYNTTNPALAPQQTATWRQMLQNGRVHDTDGFLLDGENSHWA